MTRRTQSSLQRIMRAILGGEKPWKECRTIIARLTTVGSRERLTNWLRAWPSSSERSRTRNIGRGQPLPRDSTSARGQKPRTLPLDSALGFGRVQPVRAVPEPGVGGPDRLEPEGSVQAVGSRVL